jgi:4,5-dihydroxyphthalate decarboxylase
MHLVGIRRTLHERDPLLACRVYDAFNRAKDAPANTSHPLTGVAARTPDFSAPEFWPYGVEKNRAAIAALSRYAFEQGLTARPPTLEELFVPELLTT